MTTPPKTIDILRAGVLIILCLYLAACGSQLTSTQNTSSPSPTPMNGAIISSTPLLPESAQSSIPTTPVQDTATLSGTLTHPAVVLQTTTPSGAQPALYNSYLPEVAQIPQPTNPLTYTIELTISLPITYVVLLPATPSPMLTIAATHIPIIEYHYSEYNVDNRVMMTTNWFESQMKWLSDNGFTTLSADDLVTYLNGSAFPQKSVILSFDIGTAQKDNFVHVIIPTLEKYHFTALFFVLVNDHVVTDNCADAEKICWDDLRRWQQAGLASIESHGISHADYDTLAADQMSWDAGRAYEIISTKLGTPPLGFAYPYDSIPSQAPNVIQSLGYQFAVGGNTRPDRSVGVRDADRYSLPRAYPYSNMAIYPIIGGSHGKTFDQMITSFINGS